MSGHETHDLVARALALADEGQQGTFFSAFFRELSSACKSAGTRWAMQLSWITRHLDGPARDAVEEWGSLVKYEREEDQTRAREHTVNREEYYRLKQEIAELETRRTTLTGEGR